MSAAIVAACSSQSVPSTAAPAATGNAPPTAASTGGNSATVPANPAAQTREQLKPTLVPNQVEVAAVPTPVMKMQGELTLWHDWGNVQGGGLSMLDQVNEFMKLYPGVKITNVYNATQDKILAAIASGNVPDLLKLQEVQLPTLGQRGALTDLDSYVTRDKWDMKQYFDFAIAQCTWDGKLYGMPHHTGVASLHMDQDVFKDAGLDPEKPPTDWSDLLGMGTKMTKQNGGRYVRFGYVPSWTSAPWPTLLIQANGGTLLSDDGKKSTLVSDQANEALQWALDATDKIAGGYSNTVAFSQANQTAQGSGPYWMFPQNRMGMVLFGNWIWEAISIVNPKLNVKSLLFPGGPSAKGTRFGFGSGSMVTIPKGAKSPDLAWEWLKFLGSDEGGYLTQARTSDVSANIKAANDPRIVDAHLGRKQILPLYKDTHWQVYVKSPISIQFNDEMNRLSDRVLLKQMTVKQALTESDKAIQKALDDFWATQKS